MGFELTSVRNLFVGSPNSLGERQRRKRWRLFHDMYPNFEEMRVLDLGGTVKSWLRAPLRPKHITVINLGNQLINLGLETQQIEQVDGITAVVGDACRASEVLARAGEKADFDLVYSNSVLEHVGGHSSRVELADQANALAPHHWVQTPYRYFPIEPHWLFPAMQFMPAAARIRIAQRWPLAPFKTDQEEKMLGEVLSTELLSATEMRFYFPNSQIIRERILGITKSLIATR